MAILIHSPQGKASEPSALEFLSGEWEATAPAPETGIVSTLRWSKVLDEQFYHVEYMRKLPSGSVFLGAAFYKNTSGESTTGSWADSNGELLPIEAKIEANVVTSIWGGSEKKGRTRYELVETDILIVTDWIKVRSGWKQFSKQTFQKLGLAVAETPQPANAGSFVTGIGGLFFRSENPDTLGEWYWETLGVNRAPQSYGESPWWQMAGHTVFAPFDHDTTYFGDSNTQYMVNFRVSDLDALVSVLKERGVDVDVDPKLYPNGRFARLVDPEGNAIELWEPANAEQK